MKTIEDGIAFKEVRIGQWKISYEYGILASPPGKSVFLEPRLSKLMYFLSLNINTIVSRDYLIENIWQDTVVNNESLTRAISDLRKVLSKNFDQTLEIDTISKRGYKLSLRSNSKVYALKFKITSPEKYAVLGFVLILLTLFWLVLRSCLNFH